MNELFTQGRKLVEAAWSCVPAEPSIQTRDLLPQLPESEHSLWCTRLALPFFSSREIAALINQVEEAKVANGKHPTPRRFVVWCISHHLGLTGRQVSGKIPAMHSDEAHFTIGEGWQARPCTNPI